MSTPPAGGTGGGGGGSGGGGGGIVSELRRRLGDSFSLLHAVSIRYQRGEAAAEEYYELGLDILAGDAASLLRLVNKLPDAGKREAVQRCHEAAVAELEQQLLLEEQLASEQEAAAAASDNSSGRQQGGHGTSSRDATPAAAAAAAQLLPANVYRDEQDDAALDGLLGQSSGSSGGSGGVGGLCGNRMWANADGQPLGQVIQRFLPPWQEAAQGVASSRPGTYQQLAAARKLSSSRSSGSGTAPVVPSSTPWVRPGVSTTAPSLKGAGIAATSMSALSLEPARFANGSSSTATFTAAPASSAASGSRRPVIVWLRRDLRLADNPALHAAAASGRAVLPVFIWAPQEWGRWPPGGAAMHWLHHSLASLDADLQRRYGTRLHIHNAGSTGSSSAQVLLGLVRQTGAAEVLWNRLYEPWCLARDAEVELALTGRCQLAQEQFLPYHRQPAAAAAAAGAQPGLPQVAVRTFNGSLLYEPWEVAPDQQDESSWNGGYGSVGFFLSSCQRLGDPAAPLPAPERMAVLPPAACPPGGCSLAALGLGDLPSVGPQQAQRSGRPAGPIDWAAGIRQTWQFGEAGGHAQLQLFLEEGLEHFDSRSQVKTIQSQRYEEQDGPAPAGSSGGGGRGRRGGGGGAPAAPSERFRADKRYTARISPYMAWGELSPRQVFHAALERHGPRRARTFLRRLAWRDLAYWALWRFPWMPEQPLRPQYAAQPWDTWWRGEQVELASLRSRFRRWQPEDPRLLAWQRGTTGFPLVDAGMRELWQTGYCCNYVRHIVAGFLIEYLNIDWRHGCLWFHDTLCDADVAINAMMWQNGGHSGMDQWNFVMHPVFAAKAADPEGAYVRRWCPELAMLAVPFIHAPWEAPATVLAAAGVTLGRHYPRRVLADLEGARRASLAAVVDMRRSPAGRRYVLPDGNDALPLPDGRFARAITRIDYRQMAEQPVTKQAAADLWDKGRRPLRDPMAVAMQEELRGSLGPGQAGRGGGRLG